MFLCFSHLKTEKRIFFSSLSISKGLVCLSQYSPTRVIIGRHCSAASSAATLQLQWLGFNPNLGCCWCGVCSFSVRPHRFPQLHWFPPSSPCDWWLQIVPGVCGQWENHGGVNGFVREMRFQGYKWDNEISVRDMSMGLPHGERLWQRCWNCCQISINTWWYYQSQHRQQMQCWAGTVNNEVIVTQLGNRAFGLTHPWSPISVSPFTRFWPIFL